MDGYKSASATPGVLVFYALSCIEPVITLAGSVLPPHVSPFLTYVLPRGLQSVCVLSVLMTLELEMKMTSRACFFTSRRQTMQWAISHPADVL